MKISIVIPNYNGEKLLQKNLPKVINVVMKQFNNSAIEIIVVDDGSSDASASEVKSAKLKVKSREKTVRLRLIENKSNLGFSSTVNRGVKEADGDLVVLLNTDVVPEPNFLQPLIKHFSNPEVFAVGCLQKCEENGQMVLRGRGIGGFETGFLLHARGAVSGEDTSEVSEWTPRMVEESNKTLWVSGGAGIFRKKIWQKLGGMDELYNPFYWEDIDLSYRALKAGYKLIFEPKSIVFHSQGKSIKSAYSQYEIKTIAYRNQILFVWLNITDFTFLAEHILFLPYHLVKAVVTFDHALIVGFLQALTKLPKVANHRRRNKRFSKISDREILD